MDTNAAAFEVEGLFEIDPSQVRMPEPDPYAGLSADRRRTLRQAETIAAGRHPLTGEPLHEEAAPADDRKAPGRRCGNCWHRTPALWHQRTHIKCGFTGEMGADEVAATAPPRVTHGAATDLRDWWPACPEHEYGDTQLSPDAARCVPEAVAADV
jgi:hypothetical protein